MRTSARGVETGLSARGLVAPSAGAGMVAAPVGIHADHGERPLRAQRELRVAEEGPGAVGESDEDSLRSHPDEAVSAVSAVDAVDAVDERHRDQVVAYLAAVQDPELARWIAAEERAARANPARVRLIRTGAGVGGLLVAVIGIVVWIGWAIGSSTLTSVVPGLATMKWWTATCLVALGVGIAIPTVRDTPAVRRVALCLGLLVATLALTFLFEHVTGIDLGHDNPFGFDPLSAAAHPGRMVQTTALCLLLLGTSLALHKLGRLRIAQAMATIPTALGFLALLGYVFDVSQLYSAVRFGSMAAHSAIASVIAGLAILALRSDEGYMAVVSSNTAGGRLARRLIPTALVVPPLLGWIVHVMAQRRVVDTGFGLALLATAVSALGILAIWREARALSTIDVERAGTVAALRRVRAAEASRAALATALEEHARRTEAILDSALDAFIGLDDGGRITSWNPAATRLYGWSAAEAVGTRLDELLSVFRADGTKLDARVDGLPRARDRARPGRLLRRPQGRHARRGRVAGLGPGCRGRSELHRDGPLRLAAVGRRARAPRPQPEPR